MARVQLPSQSSQIFAVCQFELLKFIRGKKILASIVIALAISLVLVVTPQIIQIDSQLTVYDYLSFPLGFLPYLLVLSAAFFGSNSLLSEFHERTGYALFPNPVSKTSVWLGKFFAAELVSFLIIGVFFGVIITAAELKYHTIPEEIFYSLGFAFVSVTSIMSIAFLVSSIFRGPTGAAVLVFFLFIMILPIIDQVLIGFVDTKPWFTPTFSSKIIENVLIVPYPNDLASGETPRGPFDVHRFVPYVSESLLVLTGYILVSSILSIYAFKKREMIS
jgi:ABC-type transport system involved in multi-copper enzyme maturation permease subunit